MPQTNQNSKKIIYIITSVFLVILITGAGIFAKNLSSISKTENAKQPIGSEIVTKPEIKNQNNPSNPKNVQNLNDSNRPSSMLKPADTPIVDGGDKVINEIINPTSSIDKYQELIK